jgi:membrane protein CcdC involved in cytochrome C biogenesis
MNVIPEQLIVMISQIESMGLSGKLTVSKLKKFQQLLDELATNGLGDESLGSKRFLFYECQAILFLYRNDTVQCIQHMLKAYSIKEDFSFISNMAQNIGQQFSDEIDTYKSEVRTEGISNILVGVLLAVLVIGINIALYVHANNKAIENGESSFRFWILYGLILLPFKIILEGFRKIGSSGLYAKQRFIKANLKD